MLQSPVDPRSVPLVRAGLAVESATLVAAYFEEPLPQQEFAGSSSAAALAYAPAAAAA